MGSPQESPESPDRLGVEECSNQLEIVLQNALYSQKDQIALIVRESTVCMCLTDFRLFISFKETTALAFRLWERALLEAV